MVRQRRIAEEHLNHNLDEHCLEDTSVRQRRGFSPELPRATWSQPNFGGFVCHLFFAFFRLAATGLGSAFFLDLRLHPTCDKFRRKLVFG